jgi:hypothetical protein
VVEPVNFMGIGMGADAVLTASRGAGGFFKSAATGAFLGAGAAGIQGVALKPMLEYWGDDLQYADILQSMALSGLFGMALAGGAHLVVGRPPGDDSVADSRPLAKDAGVPGRPPPPGGSAGAADVSAPRDGLPLEQMHIAKDADAVIQRMADEGRISDVRSYASPDGVIADRVLEKGDPNVTVIRTGRDSYLAVRVADAEALKDLWLQTGSLSVKQLEVAQQDMNAAILDLATGHTPLPIDSQVGALDAPASAAGDGWQAPKPNLTDDGSVAGEPTGAAPAAAVTSTRTDIEVARALDEHEALYQAMDRAGQLSDASRAEYQDAAIEEGKLQQIDEAYRQAATCVRGA